MSVNPSFKAMMNEVVAYGSCCECGACVLVCPHNVIDYLDGKPKQVAKVGGAFDYCGISEGIGCDVCAQVCPRLNPREFELVDQLYGSDQRYKGAFGVYRRIVVARAVAPDIVERAQDGGVVTAMLRWAFERDVIDGAVVSVSDPEHPAQPMPKLVTSIDELLTSAGSWYTYCPNNLALVDADRLGVERVAFVGVPCQITPVRKMQLVDESYLVNGRKKEKHIERQSKFLKGYGSRVSLSIGLFCTEVFTYRGLMVDKIERELAIPLTEIRKFNVKGKVLIYKKDGSVLEMPLKAAQEYARPECHHCGDFSAELADISCGGVGTMEWTITILRTRRGEELFDRMVAEGLFETRPMEEFENSMKVLLRLSNRQRARVPIPPGHDASRVRRV
ncbi:MAG: Coenzyme F420 hydrogenase/dehydrogenase, beta subunit C-terminal domain [Myxococcales bacterium]|jgi:coenzyme F420 hydrogenase subunit beta|nr:Coenzyme F420 hydrogenase/dehydrogenase, beta subunit C-terminal domain [Myxococcales bacterium]